MFMGHVRGFGGIAHGIFVSKRVIFNVGLFGLIFVSSL
jgi:hypothetical protein